MLSGFVLVAGWPGSGKSTLAKALAARLGAPLLVKDEIKEAIADGIGLPAHVDASRELGRAAVLIMLKVASRCPGAVLDSTFLPYTLPLLTALPGRLVEVRCQLPRELAQQRYRERAAGRHGAHLDLQRTDSELWGESSGPLGIAPVILVDTSGPVDVAAVAGRALAQLRTGR